MKIIFFNGIFLTKFDKRLELNKLEDSIEQK